MSRRFQLYLLLALLLLLATVIWYNRDSSSQTTGFLTLSGEFTPLSVENPFLRLDKLERIRKLEYKGAGRVIFSFQAPPKPKPLPPQPVNLEPPKPVEVPLQLPVKFFGVVSDPRSGNKRACFTNGEDVFILSEGELLQNRYRLLRIGNSTADFEDLQTGKRASLPLEQPGA
jgi:hypothetical protein